MKRMYISLKNALKKFDVVKSVYNYYCFLKTKRKAYYFQKNKDKWELEQKKLLTELLNYAHTHSRYYEQIFENLHLCSGNYTEHFEQIPLLTKEIIRKHEYGIYSKDVVDNPRVKWANTGGSTGEPLKLPVLPSRNNMEYVCQMMLYNLMGGLNYKDVIVSIDGSRIDEKALNNNVYWKKEKTNFPYGQYCMSTLHMTEDTMPYYIEFLNKIKPRYMRGYPSGFMEISLYVKKHQNCLSASPDAIYLTSENFGPLEESIITEVFKCPVYGQYGHTEESVFAIKNPGENAYRCYPFYGLTEVINKDGRHVDKGQTGEIVVTGFTNYGLPFIRYKTGDIAEYGGKDTNGTVIINKLMGRSVDYVINSKNEKVFLVGFIFGGHLKAFNHIRKWQIEQYEKGIIVLKILEGDGYNEAIEREIVNLFKTKDIDVKIEYTNTFVKTIRGKSKFLIQHIDNE